MKLFFLLIYTLFAYTLFSQPVDYRLGKLSLNGFSGFSLISSISLDSINFSKTTTDSREITQDSYSIFINSNNTNLFIDKRDDYLALSIAGTLFNINNKLKGLISSSYSEGEITEVIHHTAGIIIPGRINGGVYLSRSFSKILKTGERSLFNIGYNGVSNSLDLIVTKSTDFLTGEQNMRVNSTIYLINGETSLSSLKISNKSKIETNQKYYKRENTLKLSRINNIFRPYIGYIYEDIDRNTRLSIKHSLLTGLEMNITPTLIYKVDSKTSYINIPFYQVTNIIEYKYKALTFSPFIKVKKVQKEDYSYGLNVNCTLDNIKGKLKYQKPHTKDDWELELVIYSFY